LANKISTDPKINVLRRIGMSLRRNPQLWIGGFGVILIVGMSLFADILPVEDPLEMDTKRRFLGISKEDIGGTDEFGRDVFARTVYASRISLQVAAVAVGIGLALGLVIGISAAYTGGNVDTLLMRFMDLLFSFPAILLAIVLIAALGTSIINAAIAIGIIFIPGFARVARAVTQSILSARYIDYAKAIGTPARRIIIHEILPNIWPPLLVQASAAVAYAVIFESALSFLGLGAQPPDPSWGNMINGGRGYLAMAPWIVIVPSIALFITVISFNIFGEGMREKFDASLRRK
jgi:peptide/nickel transport system permease protein